MRAGLYDGAYYLAGYAVECALKACIAKRTRRHDFPDPELVKGLFVHDVQKLLVKAELENELNARLVANPAFRNQWDAVIQWKPENRYNINSRAQAEALLIAISGRLGVLAWLRHCW